MKTIIITAILTLAAFGGISIPKEVTKNKEASTYFQCDIFFQVTGDGYLRDSQFENVDDIGGIIGKISPDNYSGENITIYSPASNKILLLAKKEAPRADLDVFVSINGSTSAEVFGNGSGVTHVNMLFNGRDLANIYMPCRDISRTAYDKIFNKYIRTHKK